MATVTSLKFDITSAYDPKGLSAAQSQLKAIKQQIDDLTSKKIDIAADTAQVTADISDIKAQMDTLNRQIDLGVNTDDARTQLAALKAQLDDLNSTKLSLRVDKTSADADIAKLKAEMDAIKTGKIKIEVDDADATAKLMAMKAQVEDVQSSVQSHWDSATNAGRAATLNLWTALLLLLPAIVPLSGALLFVGGAAVSAFGSAALAAGAFGFSVSETFKSAGSIVTNVTSLNATLKQQQDTLAGMTKGSAAYKSELTDIASTQLQINQAMQAGTPVQQEVAKQLLMMKSAWQSVQEQAEKATGPLIMEALQGIARGMSSLVPVIDAVAGVLKPVVQQFGAFMDSGSNSSGGFNGFIAWVIAVGVPNLKNLITTMMNLGHVVADMAVAFTGPGLSITTWFAKISGQLAGWSSNGGFERFIAHMLTELPTVEKTLGSAGLAIQNVIKALDGMSSGSLTTLSIALDLLAKLPVGVVQAFFIAFAGYKLVASATAAFQLMATAVKSVQLAYTFAEEAILGFQLAQDGANVSSKEGTAALIGSKIAAMASAVANGVAAAAQWLWNAAVTVFDVLISPLVLTIGAIVLAVAAVGFGIYELVDHWNTVWTAVKTGFDVAWDAIKKGFDDAIEFLRGKWGYFIIAVPVIGWLIFVAANWQSIWGDIKAVFDDSIQGIKSAWDTVSSALTSAWNTVWNALKTAAMAVWNGLQTGWNTFINALKTAWDTVSAAVSSAWDTFWGNVSSKAEAFWATLKQGWTEFLDDVKSIWDTVSSAVSGAWSTFWNAISSTAKGIWDTISSGLSTFFDGIRSGFTKVVSDVGGIWNGIVKVFETPVNLVIGAWNDVAGVIGLPKITPLGGSSSGSTGGTSNGANYGSTTSDTVRTGGAVGHAFGGYISGPGGPRSDAIPSMLSDGEYVMQADAVNHYGVGAMDAMNAKKFSIGGLVGDVVHGVAGAVSSAVSSVGGIASVLKDIVGTAVYDTAKPVIDGIESAVPNPVPGVSGVAGSLPHAGITTIGDFILSKLKGAQAAAQAAGASVGSVPVGAHKTDIDSALSKAGIPSGQWGTWETDLNTIITKESAWNASAINNTDSNAAAGHPSQGLMQTIPSTFAAYSLGGSITDPVSNIVAGIRYILATYGTIGNVPGIKSMAAGGSYVGYDSGGALFPGMTLANNMTGMTEGILNPTGLSAIGGLDALSDLNTGGSFSGFRSVSGSGNTGGGANVTVKLEVNCESADPDEIVEAVEEKLIPQITALVNAGNGRR